MEYLSFYRFYINSLLFFVHLTSKIIYYPVFFCTVQHFSV